MLTTTKIHFMDEIFEFLLDFRYYLWYLAVVAFIGGLIKNRGLQDKKKITPESDRALELYKAASYRWDLVWVLYGLMAVLILYQSNNYFDKELRSYVDSEISSLGDDISSLGDDISNLEDEISNLTYDISRRSQIGHTHSWLEDEISNLKCDISNLEDEVSNLLTFYRSSSC